MHTPPYKFRIMKNFAKFIEHFLVLDILKMSKIDFMKKKFTKKNKNLKIYKSESIIQ